MTRLRKLAERLATDMLRAWHAERDRALHGTGDAEMRANAHAAATAVAERELRRFANAVKRPVEGWLEESEDA